ncbi:CcdC family protein [Paenibacillus humicola]|uniref:CcdC family protein n=1 Tax=Paenibacillus humicola TaxID=3110540 RepID=UPI00237B8814|nr:cytochrome c biogenesis protein CcdC [Paenibacillus humicola]
MSIFPPTVHLTHIGSLVVTILSGFAVAFLRLRASNRPTNLRKIIIPPLGMSSGFLMFVAPFMRIPLLWALGAFAVGALLLAYPLIRTSKLERSGGEIVLRRSKMFIFIILILILLRLLLHEEIERYVTIPQTGALFFVLAFGMILVWRLAMLREYLKLQRESPE